MKTNLMHALRMTAVMLVLCCGIYTLIVWGFAKVAAPQGGQAELLSRDGEPIGAALVGQLFTSDGYFQGRPSAIDYNASGSSGSNKGPSNPDYLATVQARIDTFLVHNPGVSKGEIQRTGHGQRRRSGCTSACRPRACRPDASLLHAA